MGWTACGKCCLVIVREGNTHHTKVITLEKDLSAPIIGIDGPYQRGCTLTGQEANLIGTCPVNVFVLTFKFFIDKFGLASVGRSDQYASIGGVIDIGSCTDCDLAAIGRPYDLSKLTLVADFSNHSSGGSIYDFDGLEHIIIIDS